MSVRVFVRRPLSAQRRAALAPSAPQRPQLAEVKHHFADVRVQRQPKPTPPPAPSLKSEGRGVDDPVFSGTAAIIDSVLQRNKTLAPYIGGRLKAGFQIAEKGKFVHELSDTSFESAYRRAYGMKKTDQVPDSLGFYDSKNDVIHIRPDARFGTALHESIHRLANPSLYTLYLQTAMKISENLTEVLKEGLTAHFTDIVLADEKLPPHNGYPSQKKKAAALVSTIGFDLMAKFNFQGSGIADIGNKLGITQQQFNELRGGAIKEVLKRMNDLL